jgi:multisubunit Na+/H+ antiporter MnhB subunit
MNKEPGMTLIVKTVTRLTVGIILMYGIYIVLHGHLSPGGGFAGGVIIALSFVHLMLAFGKEAAFRKLSMPVASILESTGAILFISIAFLGLAGGYFFFHTLGTGEPFSLFSAYTVLFSNIAISIKVGCGLFLVLVSIALAGKEIKK